MMRGLGRDVAAGALFLSVGAFFGMYAWLSLPLGNAFRMGPGFFPVMVGGLLALFGLGISLQGLRSIAPPAAPVPWRAVLLVTVSLIGFGLMVRPLGMAPALFVAAFCAAFASRRMTVGRAAMIAAGLTIGSAALFGYLLDLSIPLVGDWFR